MAAQLDKSHPLSKDTMEIDRPRHARRSAACRRLSGLDHGHAGVRLLARPGGSHPTVAPPVPAAALPETHVDCTAEYNEFGLDCQRCGACSIGDFRGIAEEMGYRVLVAEGSPIVMKIILSGYIDAIVGVACLNVLEKAIDKVLLAGIPCIATPVVVE